VGSSVVGGIRKWATNGTWADYFATAVRTSEGYRVLLVVLGEGVETEKIKTSFSVASMTFTL
jgi:alkylation response protein AidB-like acyl-CoA dehydrogenase